MKHLILELICLPAFRVVMGTIIQFNRQPRLHHRQAEAYNKYKIPRARPAATQKKNPTPPRSESNPPADKSDRH